MIARRYPKVAFLLIAAALLWSFLALRTPAEGGEPGPFAVTSITADCDGTGLVYFSGEIPAGGLTLTLMTKAPDNSGPFFPAPGVPVLAFTDGGSPIAYQFDLSAFDEKHYRVDSNFNTKSPSLNCEDAETETPEVTSSPQVTRTVERTGTAGVTGTPESTATPTTTGTVESTGTPTTESSTSTPVNTSTPTAVNTATKTATKTAEPDDTRTPRSNSTTVPGTASPSATESLTSQVLGGEPRQGPPTQSTTVLGLPRAGVGAVRDANVLVIITLLLIVGVGALAITLRNTASRR